MSCKGDLPFFIAHLVPRPPTASEVVLYCCVARPTSATEVVLSGSAALLDLIVFSRFIWRIRTWLLDETCGRKTYLLYAKKVWVEKETYCPFFIVRSIVCPHLALELLLSRSFTLHVTSCHIEFEYFLKIHLEGNDLFVRSDVEKTYLLYVLKHCDLRWMKGSKDQTLQQEHVLYIYVRAVWFLVSNF